jgi:hypothetical protein
MNNNDNASASISNMLDELDATENENTDPLFMMLDSMGSAGPILSSHMNMNMNMHTTVATPRGLPIPVRGTSSQLALARLAYAQTEFHNTRIRFHAAVSKRAPKSGSRHCMPLTGPQTHLTYHCWIALHKYVQLYAGWKVRRRSCDDEANPGVANKRTQYCIDAVYTYPPAQQPLAAVSDATAVTAISPATAATDGTFVDSTNVAASVKTAERKPFAQTIPSVATGAPLVAAAAVAASTTAGMSANQSLAPTATDCTTTTTTITTDHVFRYGDLVSFPVDHLTTPTTRKAIVVRVHPVNEHDDCGEDKDEEDEEDTQQVTVSTEPGERFIVPIHQLVLIQPLSIAP